MRSKVVCAASLAALAVTAFGLMAQGQKTQWDGVYTPEQAKRGASIYTEKCATCHGPELSGGEMAPALVGGDFAANWNDLTVGDLFERIRTSMPSDAPGSLSRQQNADVLAFMLQRGNYPPGATELATETEALNSFKFAAIKPGP